MHKLDQNFQKLVDKIEEAKIKIFVEDGNLRIKAAKGSVTPELRTQLSLWKSDLIAYYQAIDPTFVAYDKIQPIPRTSTSPLGLSFSQEGVWFLEKLNPGSAAYHIPIGIEFFGDIQLDKLIDSIHILMERHESLRTAFVEQNNLPFAIIDDHQDVPLQIIDLTLSGSGEREFVLAESMHRFFHEPFDLTQAPLFRVLLLKLEPDRSQLIFNFHHIIADGWSLGVLMWELGEVYQALIAAREPSLTPLDFQFADYALWLKNRFASEGAKAASLRYWQSHLAGAPELINLPTDRPRPLELDASGGMIRFTLDHDTTKAISGLASQQHVTPFMILLSAFYVLLHRYSRQNDIVVGTPVANRPHEDFANIIGFFANTIALRSEIDPTLPFLSYLKQVRQIALAGFDHQDTPFEMVVDHLQPERGSAWNPLYQVMFILQNNQMKWPESPGVKTRFLNHFDMESSKLDLVFEMWEEDGRFVGQIEYNAHLFEATSVRRMAQHYAALLENIVQNPEAKIADISLVKELERRELIADWTSTDAPLLDNVLVHELFELQAEQSADDIAIIDPERGFQQSWGDLNKNANQLAYYLKSLGVSHRDVVGVALERSADVITSLLAILKTGAAWLPLDPAYPEARLSYMIEDAKPKAIFVNSNQSWLAAHEDKVLGLNLIKSELVNFPEQNPPLTGNSMDPLYVLYTSGSTGRPKGVVGHHFGALNRFDWMWRNYPFEDGEVSIQKTTLNFVDSVWEIFGPLLKGIPLVIASEQTASNVTELVSFLAEHKISRIVLVPSLLRAILENFPNLSTDLPHLGLWTTSGEALDIQLYHRFKTAYADATLLNIYGSSEVAADVTCLDTSLYPINDRMYIGKPIDNMSVYILDDQFQPVPIGIPGELCVAGPGVALGYLNQPDLTAERFVPDAVVGDGQMFLTGDLGRYNADGHIEFLGRKDFQIKVRGVRIEPKEVELALESHDMVLQAQVGAWVNGPGETELTAWIKIAPEQLDHLNPSEIRTYLSQIVPSFLVPSKIVGLSEFPLTPNGKIDRSRLPQPAEGTTTSDIPYAPPRGDVEEFLAHVWSDILGVSRVSLHDDFFMLGGQSMLAVQLFGKIRDRFAINLNLSQLFETSTLVGLADVVRASNELAAQESAENARLNGTESKKKQFDYLVQLNTGDETKLTPFFCVHGAGGNVLFMKQWAPYLDDLPLYAFQARGIDGVRVAHQSIEEMATAYVDDLLQSHPSGPWILGGYSGGGVVALEMALQLESRGFATPPIIMLDTFHPGVQPRNFDAQDRVQLLTKKPLDYIKNATRKRLSAYFKKEHSLEELQRMMVNGEVLPLEVRNDYLSENFARALDRYDMSDTYAGDVMLICAEEIWHMFDHAGFERGWADTLQNLNVVEIPGDHFTIIQEPLVEGLVKQVIEGVVGYSTRAFV